MPVDVFDVVEVTSKYMKEKVLRESPAHITMPTKEEINAMMSSVDDIIKDMEEILSFTSIFW